MERCCKKAVVHQVAHIARAIRLRNIAGDDESWAAGKVRPFFLISFNSCDEVDL